MASARSSGKRILLLAAVSAGATFALVTLASAVSRRDTASMDNTVLESTGAPADSAAHEIASGVSKIGKRWTYLPAALVSATYLLGASGARTARPLRSRILSAGAVLLTGAVATALPPLFDSTLPQPPAPPGHSSRQKPVFPSGHAFGPGAVAFATAYLASREDVARPVLAIPAAMIVPLATAAGRVVEEKHWASDVLGGYLAAIAVAAACLAVYEAGRGPDGGSK